MLSEKKGHPNKSDNLRSKAEKIAHGKVTDVPGDLKRLTPTSVGKLMHELQVHQIELEVQNENLCATQQELEQLRARYFDLYNLAPIGYFNLSEKGIILEANLKGTNLLGISPRDLRRHPLASFILKEDRDTYYLCLRRLLKTLEPQLCELRMLRGDDSMFWARMEATAVKDVKNTKTDCLVMISDITIQKNNERSLSERQKEQACLYHIMSLFVNPDTKLTALLMSIVEIIPSGWQFPELTQARIILGGQSFHTKRFRESRWKQAREILVAGESVGRVEVCYLENPMAGTEESFLAEEGQLLDVIALRLGQVFLRFRAQESLKASQENYYSLLESSPQGIAVLQDGLLKYANSKLAKMAGVPLVELTERSFLEWVHPDDREVTIDRELRRLNHEEFESSLTLRIIDKAGNTRWVALEAAFTMWYDKPATLNFLTEITTLKEAEEAKRLSDDKYRLLADNTVDGIWLLDMDLKLTYCSPSAEKQSGFTIQEIMEMPLERYFTPESLQKVTELFLLEMPRVVADYDYDGNASLDLEFMKKDGTAFWADCKFKIIRDKQRKPQSVLVMARDISERKQAETQVREGYIALQKTLTDAIDTMAKIVEIRDPYTAGHQRRVAKLAVAIAREMRWDAARIDNLKMASLVHDIGKIYVPSDILTKAGDLEDIEFELIKMHSQYGYNTIKGIDFPASVARAILQHHERIDGSGYPNRLKGEDILPEAKIIGVADVVEAMASQRPYRPARGIEKALEEITEKRGRLYDPDVVDSCLKVCKRPGFEFESA